MVKRMAKARPSAIGSGSAGYTLVELLVVMVVIGLLLLAVPTVVSAGFPSVQAKTAAQQLAADLRAARMSAVLNGIQTRVEIDIDRRRYTIQPRGFVREPAFPIVLAHPDGDRTIRFYPDGSSSGGSISVGSGAHAHRVTSHALTGRITVDE
jgi:general secretion pathway protein H